LGVCINKAQNEHFGKSVYHIDSCHFLYGRDTVQEDTLTVMESQTAFVQVMENLTRSNKEKRHQTICQALEQGYL